MFNFSDSHFRKGGTYLGCFDSCGGGGGGGGSPWLSDTIHSNIDGRHVHKY